MSTKKIRDGTSKTTSTLSKTTKPRKPLETAKKDALKSSTRTTIKKLENEDDKNKKPLKAPLSQNTKRVSRPAPVKKIVTTAKPPSSRPDTPPTGRIAKSQFFPSKNMYSNALIRDNGKKVVKDAKSILTPTTSINDEGSDTSSVSERPGTATLRRGSIVNKNIAGPEAPKIKKTSSKSKLPIAKVKVEEPPTEYEDDFDSYESDFDEYNSSSSSSTDMSAGTSSSETTDIQSSEEIQSSAKSISSAGTDDEKKLDSGNYELPESRHRQILDNIKESIEKENANLRTENSRSHLGSLSDEGFEDGKSLQFINFLGAQKKYQHRKSVQLRRKRGEELLSMIRLDHYSFTLYDVPPVPYDIFIKRFGKSNTVQASVQTGDDNQSEEIQTDEILTTNKWTQCPPHLTKIEESEHFWVEYKSNYLGVGGDAISDQNTTNTTNEARLEKFIISAGNLILNLQAESNVQIQKGDKSNIPFSKSFILFDTQAQDVLKSRPINDVCFCSSSSNKILTVHGPNDQKSSVICIWNLANVEVPEMLLSASGEVVCCIFSSECPNLVFAGLSSGSLVVWDTKETSSFHRNSSDEDVFMRTPTYSTEINYGHSSRIVSIQSVVNTEKEVLFSLHTSTEICSLDEDGDIVVWSVIFKDRNLGTTVESQGLAHWGSVILAINVKISLRKLYPEIDDFNCTDLAFSNIDSSHLYISTNHGIIMHCLTNGGKTGVKKFLPNVQTQANCLDICPFSFEYLLVGFDNGDVNFYCRNFEKPLMILSNKDSAEGRSKIQKVQWSQTHPLIFYTKDVTNTVHIWNLKVNDMFPISSVPFKDEIVSMKLSPMVSQNDDTPGESYMMIATKRGLVYVYLLNEDHGLQPVEEWKKDQRKFINYINRYI